MHKDIQIRLTLIICEFYPSKLILHDNNYCSNYKNLKMVICEILSINSHLPRFDILLLVSVNLIGTKNYVLTKRQEIPKKVLSLARLI